MLECSILLEAHNPSRNVFRSYGILAYYDLFQRLIVEVVQGRIGTKGKRTPHFVQDAQEAITFITTLLVQQTENTRRIGAPYQLKHYQSNWNLNAAIQGFSQAPDTDSPLPSPKIKKPVVLQEIIREGEGLFCYDEPMLFY